MERRRRRASTREERRLAGWRSGGGRGRGGIAAGEERHDERSLESWVLVWRSLVIARLCKYNLSEY